MTRGKILIVEDSPDLRELFHQALALKDIEHLSFGSGESALEFLMCLSDIPALAFIDLTLPKMSGEELIAKIRADSHFNNTKIIITSGGDNLQSIAKTVGADGFLKKAFSLDAIYQVIDRELK